MSRVFRFTLILVLLTIVGSVTFVCYRVFFGASSQSVPMVKNISVIEAVEELERMGIPARIDQEESGLPQGVVVSQWPEPGMKVREDSPVILKVSRGTAKKPLPDLRGQVAAQATATLEAQGFTVGDIVKIHSERPAGVVIAQSPSAPESISPSRTVDLLVSLGPSVANGLVIIPDLRDQNIEAARALIAESNLRARVVHTYTQASPEGMVIAMSPAAGTQVARNTEVTLRVASWDPRYAERKSASGAKVVVLESRETERAPSPSPAPVPSPDSVKPPAVSSSVPAAPEPVPAPSAPVATPPRASGNLKKAVIRYQVPPMSNGLILRIEIVDRSGTRTLVDRKVKDGEYINITESYADEAVVTIYLGGEFVWQDRYK